ncbi:hypothetical protein BDZ97DRAFT_1988692 [Flammula alnicola]|nr:hypothetical protein BDZ97DRAFT_1988692 [Flammula alnicola]
MSDYWVSKKKYFCKYCEIYIADDAPSRKQHEIGLRHKGNVERFIRGIYKTGEKQKKDLEEEKREMKRVEQAPAAAFAEDVGAGFAKPAGPVASTSAAPKKPSTKPSNPFANYSTAQSLGYTDPDAERIAVELEVRRSQGIAGEWQTITPPQPPVASSSTLHSGHPDAPASATGEIGVKREAEAPPDEDDARAFKLRKKTLSMGLGESYDPELIPVKLKKKEEPDPSKTGITDSQAPTMGVPKWTSTQWKRPGDASQQANGQNGPSIKHEDTPVKLEDKPSSMVADGAVSGPSKWAKPQWSQPLPDFKQEERKIIFGTPEQTNGGSGSEVKLESDVKEEVGQTSLSEPPSLSGGSLFKKRKAPSGAGRGRRQI